LFFSQILRCRDLKRPGKEKNLARSTLNRGDYRGTFSPGEKEIERSRRRHPLTPIPRLDNFKNVNDKFGHQIGNRFLHFLATILESNTRTIDIVARLGGDEFAILMPETGEQIVPQAVQQLHARLVCALRKMGWPVTLSMGAAIYLDPPVRRRN
jgi:diguanylate cyclase (GGDEF)-like protein